MIASFLITFREALEAALVVGIVLGYLARTGQGRYRRWVYLGTLGGLVASIVGAWLFSLVAGGLEGRSEQLFEGVTMLVGALLLTTMILWMSRQQHMTRELESKVAGEIAAVRTAGMFLLVFVAILREGIETVIFLSAASFAATGNNLPGALAGIAAAMAVGYGLFVGSLSLSVRTFFRLSSVLLVLFAAGLVAHSVHELGEAGLVPPLIEHVWDINPSKYADGSYPPLHENGWVGSILASLLGYDGDPSLAEVLSYFVYLIGVTWFWRRPNRLAAPSPSRPKAAARGMSGT